ncbi:MAG: helix-turn-helix transcriptional regulator [Lachnospiraceae bacterium]|nr:helix-turn-helix transcriptional regulator [Lachnospiraceae bacterium]
MEINNLEVGRRIAHMRNARRMTQENLAERLDCSVKHISHVERGVAAMSLDKLLELSEIFDCSLDYLVKGTKMEDICLQLPPFVFSILESRDERERTLFMTYLSMYRQLRSDGEQQQ